MEKTEVNFIIRDFDKDAFEDRKGQMASHADALKAQYGEDRVILDMNDQYYNMRDRIEPHMEIVEYAKQAMEALDITPVIIPVRGGTDGSQLSYKGLPTPNLFTGGENFHGKFEYISVDNMEQAVKVITGISRNAAEQK